MTLLTTTLEDQVVGALDTVIDPELDEPITDLGFVRTIEIDDRGVRVHLRLPTSFCSPNFSWLMASDALDALDKVPDIGRVDVFLDDHHDSEKINQGLANRAGYRGTFGVEALESLDSLRLTFQRKAHTAAMERVCTALLAAGTWKIDDLADLTLADLPDDSYTEALLNRRRDLGMDNSWDQPVLVDEHGVPISTGDVPMRLRFAKSVRISMEGNSHFCRGLLATRYSDEETDRMPRISNTRDLDPHGESATRRRAHRSYDQQRSAS